MRQLIIIFLLLLSPAFIEAQVRQKKSDSLHRALTNAANDSIRMDIYDQLEYFFQGKSRDSSRFYKDRSLRIANRLKLQIHEDDIFADKGILLRASGFLITAQEEDTDSLRQAFMNATTDSIRYMLSSILGGYYTEVNWDSALYYKEVALHLAKTNNKKLDEAAAQNNKGYTLMQLGRFPESYQCFQEALKLAGNPENEEKTWWSVDKENIIHSARLYFLAYIHNDFSHLLRTTGKTYEAIFHLMETKKIALQTGNQVIIGWVDKNIGKSYVLINKLDSALILEESAVKKLNRNEGRKYLSDAYHIMGQIYLKQNNSKRAIQNFHQGIQSATEQKNFTYLTENYSSLTRLYTENEKNKDSSLYYARKNLALLLSMESRDLGNAFQNLYRSYQLNGNIDSAYKYQGLALAANDSANQARIKSLLDFQNMSFDDQLRLKELEREKVIAENRIQMYAMLAGLAACLVIGLILFYSYRKKQEANKVLEHTLSNLKSTQFQLIQSEKMASLGELTAGIAHEIQNPLNFVNNFSEINKELTVELEDELSKGNVDDIRSITKNIRENEEKISLHGKRADAIVKNMLQHSRSASGTKVPTDINALADEFLRLAYHGIRGKDGSFNATMQTDFDQSIGKIDVVPQDIGRVLLNLYNNAFYACAAHFRDKASDIPVISVSTKKAGNKIEIAVTDNGIGISRKIIDKIFQPFFTTKPTGQGTGLGLSLAYDIVKSHGGEIKVSSVEMKGSEFIVTLNTNA